MESLPLALIASHDAMSQSARSALPDAPVIPARVPVSRSPRLGRTRGLLASALRRTAEAIAPPACSPVA